jgi:endonuclease IV
MLAAAAIMLIGPHVNRYHAQSRGPGASPRGPGAGRPGLAEHIEAARAEALAVSGFKVTAAAVFVGGPSRREITLTPEERPALREYLARSGIRVIAHSAYCAAPWGGDPAAARHIREELGVCQEAGISGLVVHLPKLPVGAVMRHIRHLQNPDAPDVRVYLETPAVRPAESYYERPAKLAQLFAAIRAEVDPELAHFGLCVDTAHLWVCGVDLQSYEAASAWLDALESISDVVPPEAVMFHLNDSIRPRGVGPDAHAPLAAGMLWGPLRGRPGRSGLAAFVDYALRHAAPVILERAPKESLANDYQILRELAVEAAA